MNATFQILLDKAARCDHRKSYSRISYASSKPSSTSSKPSYTSSKPSYTSSKPMSASSKPSPALSEQCKSARPQSAHPGRRAKSTLDNLKNEKFYDRSSSMSRQIEVLAIERYSYISYELQGIIKVLLWNVRGMIHGGLGREDISRIT